MEVRNKIKLDLLVEYLSSLEEVEGVLVNYDTNNKPTLSVVCYKKSNNYLINELPIVVNNSSSYDLNKPNYYFDKLMCSEILYDRDYRLSTIKNNAIGASRKLAL